MRKIILSFGLILAAVLVCAPNATAQADVDALLSPDFKACMENPDNMTTSGMVQCMGAERERHDARLNAVYQQLMQTLPEDKRQELKEAQRAWIKFRDDYADLLYGFTGGSIDRLNAADWLMRSTALQARELEYLLGPEQ